MDTDLLRSLRQWTRRWKAKGILLLLKVRMVVRASDSALSLLDPSTAWARKAEAEMV